MRKIRHAYDAIYTDAIVVAKGEVVVVQKRETKPEWAGWVWCILANGKSGWISENYLKINGVAGILLKDYDAREASVKTGEQVKVLQIESGWAWIRKADLSEGWIPVENLEPTN